MTTETTNTDAREFDGAIHDQADARAGANRGGERVFRIDVTYTRGTAASQTTLILTQAAAAALRDALDAYLPEPDGIGADRGLYGADAYDLQRFAEAYAGLGDAVGEQVWDLLDGNDEVNPTAVRLIRERLGGMNRELDDALESYDAEDQD